MKTSSKDLWEEHADWWQREFTEGVDAEYEEQIIPLALELLAGSGRVLDLGTGEGQIARRLAATCEVVGMDGSWAQLVVGDQRNNLLPSTISPIVYTQADATKIPTKNAAFDAVLVCLMFEHIDDLDAAMAEVTRVLKPGGRFVLMINHPLIQTPGSGWIDDQILDPPEQYWRIGPYLTEQATHEQVQRDVWTRFVHRPLSRYLNTAIGEGLILRSMQEPAPPPGFLARAKEYEDAATVPRLMVLCFEKSTTATQQKKQGDQ